MTMMRRRARVRMVQATTLVAIAGGVMMLGSSAAEPVVRTVSVGVGPSAIALDDRTGLVFVANYNDSTVSVLDADGRLLHTAPAGGTPLAAAVDARDGCVVVVSSTLGALASPGRVRV